MKKTLLYLLTTLTLWANDGAYTMSGNQLIPIKESKISIKKEVLTIKRLKDNLLDVKVEYTFFNPNKAKKVLVGFEASEPEGDVQSESKNGEHPYMKNFSVMINSKSVAYKVSGGINGTDFGYVYSFQANFNKGINYITHHYRYEPSSSTGVNYEIDYILSAASRWANGVIEDFTLIIDVGEYERVSIAKTFFKKASQWDFDGVSKDILSSVDFEKGGIRFYISKGVLTFKKKNFKPTKELYLLALRGTPNAPFYIENFNYKKDKLPFKIGGMYIEDILPKDKMSYKIFKNLPYARRGYIFKNKTIQKYYESLEWYRENPNYVPKWSDLTKEKNEWTIKLRKQSLELLKNLPFAKRGYVFKKAYLQNYFQQQYWYVPNKSYKVVMSELSAHEKKWLQEVKKLKVTDNFDLYEWIDKYNQNYDNCLHKHEKKKVEQFLGNFVKYEKYKNKEQIIERLGAKFFKNGKVEHFEIYEGILEELSALKKYDGKENTKEEVYKTYFRKDKKKEGCYEYLLQHDVNPKDYSEGEYNIWIGVGKENNQFKFVRLDVAG